MQPQQRRRRIDRVLEPGYLERVEERASAEVRVMRDECREEEAQLSYLRRVLQGQLDIALVELSRRGQDSDGSDLVAELPSILSEGPRGDQRDPRSLSLYEPDDTGKRTGDAERFATQVGMVPELDDGELGALVNDLRATERQISDQRRQVLDRLDRLQAELVRRYREGAASVDDLVAPTLAPGSDDAS